MRTTTKSAILLLIGLTLQPLSGRDMPQDTINITSLPTTKAAEADPKKPATLSDDERSLITTYQQRKHQLDQDTALVEKIRRCAENSERLFFTAKRQVRDIEAMLASMDHYVQQLIIAQVRTKIGKLEQSPNAQYYADRISGWKRYIKELEGENYEN